MTDTVVVANVLASMSELRKSHPGVALAAAGRVDDVLELWQMDGGDRLALVCYLQSALLSEQFACAERLVQLLTKPERVLVAQFWDRVVQACKK